MPVTINDHKIDQTKIRGNDTYAYYKGKLVVVIHYDPFRDVTTVKDVSS